MFKAILEEYYTRLLTIIDSSNQDLIRTTIKKWLETKSDDNYTILHYASFRGNVEILKILYKYDIEANVVNIRGVNPFHMAAQGDSPNTLVFLKEKFNVNINSVDNDNTNALQWACYTGAENSFIYLLSFQMDLNSQNTEGLTALHLATLSESSKIVKKLVQRGADVNMKDIKGRTPYDLALEKNKFVIVDMFKESQGCQLCICHNPVQKTDRSYFNVILFICLHLFIEGWLFFILLPRKYSIYNKFYSRCG